MTTSSPISSLIGHKSRCFDVRYSADGSNVISASEDGTVRLWDSNSRKCNAILKHSKDSEVLRCAFLDSTSTCSSIASGGSDGKVVIWKRAEGAEGLRFKKQVTLQHGNESSQVYSCEVSGGSVTTGTGNGSGTNECGATHMLVAADSQLYYWDMSTFKDPRILTFKSLDNATQSTAFGGPRNPDNEVYIFDAKPSSVPHTMATVLSDETVRLLDMRCRSSTVLAAALNKHTSLGHPTSLSWDQASLNLLICFGSGRVALFDTRTSTVRGFLAGHRSAAFGTCFYDGDRRCLSWSSDSTLRTWDLTSLEQVSISTTSTDSTSCSSSTNTISRNTFFSPPEPLYGRPLGEVKISGTSPFPVYSCAISPSTSCVVVGGGGGEEDSFVGAPISIFGREILGLLPAADDADSVSRCTNNNSDSLGTRNTTRSRNSEKES